MYFYSAMSFTFPKKEKLKSKKLIEQLFVEGKSVSQYPIKLIYLKVDQQEALIKAGVAVPKKKFKSAVSRNHLKRLLRESYRLNKALVSNNTEDKFAFLFLYIGKETLPFEVMQHKMTLLLKKFNAHIL
ncbi:MAG: ribonuclease P protein component [Maribacter sp.]|jgi:ribonuclease P protein component|tara:strand:+ start:387 stop:773 length:387 start_codon:yes stop_codon:yes gene_type:complete